jgi:hypothetical protein
MAMMREECDDEGGEDLVALLREIRNTTYFFDPPDDFNPLEANPDELGQYGIPPQPDAEAAPEHFKLWMKLFAPPLRFETAEFSFQAAGTRLNPRGPVAYRTRHEASANWSGAYITPKHDRMFTELFGSWYVPNPSPPATAGGLSAHDEFRSSTWIGLDGQRRYRNSSLPQIGTAQFVRVVDGQPVRTFKTWWQWWMRGQRNPPVTLSLKIRPGDLVTCSLIVVDRRTVRFFIKNRTTGIHLKPFQRNPPSPALTISGATAEWVMERPTHLSSDKLYPLPQYDSLHFSDCLAIAAHAPGERGHEEMLPGARLIDMYEVREHPHRIAEISVAKREGDQEVATFFR